jgi:hypothetical protein
VEKGDIESVRFFDELQYIEQREILAKLYLNAYERYWTTHQPLREIGLLSLLACAPLVITILFLHAGYTLNTIYISIGLLSGFFMFQVAAEVMERRSNLERVMAIKELANQYNCSEILEDIDREERHVWRY